MSPFASSLITFARFRLQLLMESFRQTRVVVTFCVAFCVARFAMAVRSVFTNHSFSNLSTSRRKRWATCSPQSARNNHRSKKQSAAKNKHLTKHSIGESRFSKPPYSNLQDTIVKPE